MTWVNFTVATLVCRGLHSITAPSLSSALRRVAYMESRRWLRSLTTTDMLIIPLSQLVTAGDRSFPVAGP